MKQVLQPGTVIQVPKMAGLILHSMTYVGPVGAQGEDVINNNPTRGVHLGYLRQEIAGQTATVAIAAPANWWEQSIVVERAMSQLNRPWRLFGNNCEDTARYARTGRTGSPQLLFWSMLLVVIGIVCLLSRR